MRIFGLPPIRTLIHLQCALKLKTMLLDIFYEDMSIDMKICNRFKQFSLLILMNLNDSFC